ncbi:MAG TPA: TetR/AcrR family transcriptional regulator, partial [Methanomassiliicoccales archaeon]|nr:TetR/AcrR family transcriptional regulator [Methanomassiliicoccales archaeon]
RKELLDGVMEIIKTQGFSKVTISEMAAKLHCSASSLYKIAPNKDSLIVLAINQWGELALRDWEARAVQGKTASTRAHLYYRAAVEGVSSWSHDFRNDVNRFESARLAYAKISDNFINRFADLLNEAVEEGEVRSINTKFLANVFRQMALVIRDEQLLSDCGMTHTQALFEVERIIWDGIRFERHH